MKPIQGVEPSELLTEAALQLINEQRNAATSQIKDCYRQVQQLSNDIKTMRQAMEKKEKELEAAQNRIEKFRSGDWNVLQDPKPKEDQKADSGKEAKL